MKNLKKLIATALILTCLSLTAYTQNKPSAEYKIGKTRVTVWDNKQDGKYAKKKFKVEKNYKENGKWVSTNYFTLEELLQLRAAIDKAISEEVVKVNNK